MRYAIYYTPPADDPLTRIAAGWLGRDAFTGRTLPHCATGSLTPADLAYHTAAARRYGFHATLKAPFELADDATEGELIDALDAFCRRMNCIALPRLVLRQLDGFLALVPEQRFPRLDELAREIVIAFDGFRAPLSDADLARRNPDALTPVQLKYLHQWGYPYVFDEFRFHMTLTGRVVEVDAPRIMRSIEDMFGPVLEEPVDIASLGLFIEPEPGAPFTVRSFHQFGRVAQREAV